MIDTWLEIASELTAQFELIIVDDGSVDDTAIVASELTQYYPQVRLIHHRLAYGSDAALQSGLRVSSGETILFHDGNQAPGIMEVQRLWQLRNDPSLVMAHGNQLRLDGGGQEFGIKGMSARKSGGTRLLRRRAIEQIGRARGSRLPMQVRHDEPRAVGAGAATIPSFAGAQVHLGEYHTL